MSGGHFNMYGGNVAEELNGEWRDEEVNALFFDLFGESWYEYRSPFFPEGRRCEFGPHGGGLFEALDYWLSGDTSEGDYREELTRFKRKWLIKRTPRDRVEFYQGLFEEYARNVGDALMRELGEYPDARDDG